MEVHHPHHAPKNWKEYFSEFFMLFLAVSLGFLVENQREHYVEGHRANELAQALLKDLMADSIDFREFQDLRVIERNSVELAIQRIEKQGLQANDPILYYHFIRGVFVWRHPEFRQANLDQIISSGSLRYFKNEDLVQSISDLKMELKRIEFRQDREKEYFYANVQPWVVKHLNLAHVDAHRKGLPRAKMMEILLKNQNFHPLHPYFLNTDDINFAPNTANILRGSDWLMNVTQSSYYQVYKRKTLRLRKLIRDNFPEI